MIEVVISRPQYAHCGALCVKSRHYRTSVFGDPTFERLDLSGRTKTAKAWAVLILDVFPKTLIQTGGVAAVVGAEVDLLVGNKGIHRIGGIFP